MAASNRKAIHNSRGKYTMLSWRRYSVPGMLISHSNRVSASSIRSFSKLDISTVKDPSLSFSVLWLTFSTGILKYKKPLNLGPLTFTTKVRNAMFYLSYWLRNRNITRSGFGNTPSVLQETLTVSEAGLLYVIFSSLAGAVKKRNEPFLQKYSGHFFVILMLSLILQNIRWSWLPIQMDDSWWWE